MNMYVKRYAHNKKTNMDKLKRRSYRRTTLICQLFYAPLINYRT